MITNLSKHSVIAAFVAAFMVMATVGAHAGSVTAEPTILKLLRKNYTSSTTIDAPFELQTFWSAREKTEQKTGRLLLAPGDKFRIELGKEVYVSNGKLYWQYNQKAKQVLLRDLKDIDLSMHPSQLLANFLNKYTYSQVSTGPSSTELVWNADSSLTAPYKTISLQVDPKGMLQKIRMVDEFENVHTYTFRKTVLQKKIPLKEFEFEAPQDVQVMDMRK